MRNINLVPGFCTAAVHRTENLPEGTLIHSSVPAVMEFSPEEERQLSAIEDFGKEEGKELDLLREVLGARLSENSHIRVAGVSSLIRGCEYPEMVRDIAKMEKDLVMESLIEDLGDNALKPFSAFLRTAAGGNGSGEVIRGIISEAEGDLSPNSPCIFCRSKGQARSYPMDDQLVDVFTETGRWVVLRAECCWFESNSDAEKALLRSIFGEEN